MLDDIWIRDCMTREFVTCADDTTLAEIAQELQAHLFSCLVIVNKDEPTGIFTERDLTRIFSQLLENENWRDQSVKDHMTKNPQALYEDLSLMEAIEQMHADRIRYAPVVDGENKVVGVLTQADIVESVYQANVNSQE